jgi:hypothetical protein
VSRKFLVPLVLPADPTAALEAATKQYADARVLAAWPIGSIYTSTVNTNPSTFFGGTWAVFDAGSAIAVNSPATTTLYYWRRTA